MAIVSKLQSACVSANGTVINAHSPLLKINAETGDIFREINPDIKPPKTEATAIPVKTTADHFGTPSIKVNAGIPTEKAPAAIPKPAL